MVETDHRRDLPDAVLVLPEMDELRLADAVLLLAPRMVKAMDADLERTA
jgi:hypothetical protein